MVKVLKGGKIVQVRKFVVGALVGGMVLMVPGVALADGGGGGPLGGILGGTHGLLGGNGCKEDELVSVGGDAGVVGVNLAGPIDSKRLLSLGGSEDELLSLAGDSGIISLGHELHLDKGLVGLNASPCDD
jgi:hypothetical protein